MRPLPSQPAPLYASFPWRIALLLARGLPAPLYSMVARTAARGYASVAARRRRVVLNNFLPVTQSDSRLAREAMNRLFLNFADKLVDLWRYEAGADIRSQLVQPIDSMHLDRAVESGRGILMVTVHLGNWEFGTPLLQERKFSLLAVTQEEPDPRLTKLREKARRDRGVETVVISNEQFGFVKLIRHLEAGGVAAMLMDRPSSSTGIEVEFFGQPFRASVAVAELARASGAVVLPVILPRIGRCYQAQLFPPVDYDRKALRSLEHRHSLTQRTLQVFESSVRQYLDQWYHFVPVWNQDPRPRNTGR